jgi:hypothetical protein
MLNAPGAIALSAIPEDRGLEKAIIVKKGREVQIIFGYGIFDQWYIR